MLKTIPFFFAVLFIIALFPLVSSRSIAAVGSPKTSGVNVSVSIGEFYLNLSGYASPFSSIILTSEGIFYRAAVADEHGNFSISQILIQKGFSSFCLLHVDFKRLGDSTACFQFSPATADITMNNIFLPPTIGVQRGSIIEGSDAVVFGYTMPLARVTVHLSDGRTFVITADSTGFYQVIIAKLKAGSYELYATAVYNSVASEVPTDRVIIKSLSKSEQAVTTLTGLTDKLKKFLEDLPLGPLWLAIPILILIIILLKKLWPRLFSSPIEKFLFFFKRKKKEKPLHHLWFVGY